MGKQSKQYLSMYSSQERDSAEERQMTQPQCRRYESASITSHDWLAIVDLEKNMILYVDCTYEQADDVLREVIIPDEEDTWSKEHPEHKAFGVPSEVEEVLKKRFAIIECSVIVVPGAKIRKGA